MNHINNTQNYVCLKQKTITDQITFSGVGIHNGRAVTMVIDPAEEDTGIIFKRIDLKRNNIIKAKYSNIDTSSLCTRLINEKGVTVSTIEHLMAAFSAFGIDNAIVSINDAEIPALDGSSYEYVKKLTKCGIKEQKKNKKRIKLLRKIKASDGKRFISISPSDDLYFNIVIDYPNTIIGRSELFYTHSKENFIDFLSQARTYTLYEDIDKMRASGQAMGGNLNNAIVVDKYKILNPGGLRLEKEFVKHKTLDCIGDLYLLGMPLTGEINCFAPGHSLNQKLISKILEDQSNYKIEDALVEKSIDQYSIFFNNNSSTQNFINVA